MNTDSKSLRVLFWNARSINKRKHELPVLLLNIDIFICVESWLQDRDNNSCQKIDSTLAPGFVQLQKNREDSRGGGILIMVRKSIAFREISIESPDKNIEVCKICLTNTTPSINITACYRAKGILNQEHWDFIASLADNDRPNLLVGDFNAHHFSWNSYKTDSNGESLANSIEKYNLFLHNYDTITRINPINNNHSNIDLVLSSLDVADKIVLRVLDDPLGSDHFPIFFSVNLDKNLYRKKSFKIRSLNTKWENFDKELDDSFSTFLTRGYSDSNPSGKYKIFFEIILSCLIICTPSGKFFNSSKRRNPVPWWDEECNRVKRLRKAAYKKWNFSKTQGNRIDYNRYNCLAVKTYRNKKKAYFKKFAETLDFNSNLSYVWNKCKILKDKWTTVQPTNVNSNLQNSELIGAALDKICPPWCEADPGYLPGCKNTYESFFDHPFDFAEFNMALDSKRNKSAAGLDGIDYVTLKRLPLKYKLILLDIFNEMYSKDCYPDDWSKSFVLFINKPDNRGVRPISLSASLCKLFESLVKNRLQWFCERHNILPIGQSGFRKGRSCIDNLVEFIVKAKQALNKKKDTIAAFLDVQGAFDNVHSEILLDKLASIGCSTKLVCFIKFLTRRRIIHTDHLKGETRLSYKGVPQGGVLSPLLYLIYVKDISKNVPRSVSISQFADDIAVYCNYGPANKSKNLIQKAVSALSQNLSEIGLRFEPSKTVLLHINNKGIKPEETSLNILDCQITSSSSARFLGLTIDYRLNFSQHINRINQQCFYRTNIIKFICGVKWGAHPSTVLTLYKSLVRSIIDYGSFVYFPQTIALCDRLEKIQLSCLRIAMGYRSTTPNNVVLAESKVQTIKERTKFLCMGYLCKVISNCNHPVFKAIHSLKDKSTNSTTILRECIVNILQLNIRPFKNFSIFTYDYDTVVMSVNINTELGIQMNEAADPNAIIIEYLRSKNSHALYTDGSKNSELNSSVGSSCYYADLNIKSGSSLPTNTSIFTAECFAIFKALQLIHKSQHTHFTVVSDSLSALQSLASRRLSVRNNYHILKIKKLYCNILKGNPHKTINFVWCPSHINIKGNEIADKLAKSFTRKRPLKSFIIPGTDFTRGFKHDSYQNTIGECLGVASYKGSNYFSLYFNHSPNTWFHGSGLSRNIITGINRIRSGHYNLCVSLFRVNITRELFCARCGDYIEDLNHVVWQCQFYDEDRKVLISKICKRKILLPQDTGNIFFYPNSPICTLIVKFLDLIGRPA